MIFILCKLVGAVCPEWRSRVMQSTKKTGIAICGFGRAGQIHFTGVLKNYRCRLLYIVDLVQDTSVKSRIQTELEEFMVDDVKIVGKENYEKEVLKDANVDAVIVTTPTGEHEHYVRRALTAGKAVFCEKPIAATQQAINECYDLAEEVNKPLFCAFNRRYDTGMSSLRQKVINQEIGKLYQIRTTSRDSPLPPMTFLKLSGGIFHDCAVHDIDIVCWIVGEEPCGIFAQGSAFDPEIKAIGDMDTVAIVLKFPSGVIATIELNRHSQYGYDQRLEVLGSKGMIQVGNVTEDSVQVLRKDGRMQSPYHHSFPQRYEEAYLNELDTFLTIVRDPYLTSPHPVTRKEVLLSSRVADACERSLKEGKMVTLC